MKKRSKALTHDGLRKAVRAILALGSNDGYVMVPDKLFDELGRAYEEDR